MAAQRLHFPDSLAAFHLMACGTKGGGKLLDHIFCKETACLFLSSLLQRLGRGRDSLDHVLYAQKDGAATKQEEPGTMVNSWSRVALPSCPGARAELLQSCPTPCDPMDCSRPGSSVHGDSPGKNTGVGCHAFFQGDCPDLGIKPRLLCLLH